MPTEARRRLTPRARWGIVAVALVAVAAAGLICALAWRDLRPVRTDLVSARQTLQLTVDDPAALRTPEGRSSTLGRIDAAVRTIRAARHRLDDSLPFRLTGFIPFAAHQHDGVVDLLDDAAAAATAGRRLVADFQPQQEQAQLQQGNVPYERIGRLSAAVRAAGKSLHKVVRPSSGLVGALGDARREFNDVAGTTSARLLDGADALDAAQTFMGATGDRRHLIALQNNAEMRDQGMMLSYAVAHFAGGRLTFERGGSVTQIPLDHPAPTPVPAGTQAVFGSIRPTELWQSVNATADFPWSARAMADMYRQAVGETIDGVIAIDVPGLARLLRVIGAVQVPGVAEPLTADNATRILLHDQYEGLKPTDSQNPRLERLALATGIVIDRLTTGTQDTVGLARELGEAAAGGHFRLWSPIAGEERVFERTGLGGGPATSDAAGTFHLAVENRTSTKLDYYVQPTVHQDVRFSGKHDVVVRTTVDITNTAPSGPPSYQLGPDEFTSHPGDYTGWVLLWGPAGSRQPAGVAESGLTLTPAIVSVGSGESRTVVFDTFIPNAVRNGRLRLRFVPQPRLKPVDLTVTLDTHGRRVTGPTTSTGPWDRTRQLTWRVSG